MARNSNYKEDILTIFFIAISLIISIIAWIGLGDFVGFLNETGEQQSFSLHGFELFMSGPVNRYIHLAIIPTIFGTVVIAIERAPVIGSKIKRRNPLNPVMLSMITAICLTIQIIPAVVGLKNDDGSKVSATWFSDWVMIQNFGYVILTIGFVVSIITGFYYSIFWWLKHRGKTTDDQNNIMMTIAIIVATVFSFIGLGSFEGFFALHDVHSFQEYQIEHGWVALFSDGPLNSYAHLVVLPGIFGLIVLAIGRIPALGDKIVAREGGKKSRKGSKKFISYEESTSKLSIFALFFIMIQLLPAIIGVPETESGTWFSDKIMNPYGYGAMGFTWVISSIAGLVKGLTGGIFERGSYTGS